MFFELVIGFKTGFLCDLQQGKIGCIDEQFPFPQRLLYSLFLVEPDVEDFPALRPDYLLHPEIIRFKQLLIKNRVMIEFHKIIDKITSKAPGAFPGVAQCVDKTGIGDYPSFK